MGKRVVYALKADEGLIPDGWTTSDYLRACIKAYKKWAYVTKGIELPKGWRTDDYVRVAWETFSKEYICTMKDGKPVFYKGKPNSPKSKPESIFSKMGMGKDNNILPR